MNLDELEDLSAFGGEGIDSPLPIPLLCYVALPQGIGEVFDYYAAALLLEFIECVLSFLNLCKKPLQGFYPHSISFVHSGLRYCVSVYPTHLYRSSYI